MDQYIKTIISVGGSAIMLVMIICVIWYVIKDTLKAMLCPKQRQRVQDNFLNPTNNIRK